MFYIVIKISKLTISLKLLFLRITNNKSMQKIMYFSLNSILYNKGERKFYKYVMY